MTVDSHNLQAAGQPLWSIACCCSSVATAAESRGTIAAAPCAARISQGIQDPVDTAWRSRARGTTLAAPYRADMTSAQDPSPIRTSGVVVFDGENVLMVMPGAASKHEPGVLGLPAGRVDPGETERDAGARECREETGVIVDPAELVELPRRYRAASRAATAPAC